MRDRILEIVFEGIDEINLQRKPAERLQKSETTALFGEGSQLDSLGLVNFAAQVEQRIETEFDRSISIIEQLAGDSGENPLRNIGTLVVYLEKVLSTS